MFFSESVFPAPARGYSRLTRCNSVPVDDSAPPPVRYTSRSSSRNRQSISSARDLGQTYQLYPTYGYNGGSPASSSALLRTPSSSSSSVAPAPTSLRPPPVSNLPRPAVKGARAKEQQQKALAAIFARHQEAREQLIRSAAAVAVASASASASSARERSRSRSRPPSREYLTSEEVSYSVPSSSASRRSSMSEAHRSISCSRGRGVFPSSYAPSAHPTQADYVEPRGRRSASPTFYPSQTAAVATGYYTPRRPSSGDYSAYAPRAEELRRPTAVTRRQSGYAKRVAA